MVPASFAQRALGRCIDLVVLSLLIGAAFMPFTDGDSLDVPPLFFSAVLIAVLAYEIVPVHLNGQTAGKAILRTRVVSVDGGPVSLRSSFVRWAVVCAVWIVIGGLLSPPLAIVVMAALYLSALADPGGRSVLDKLAHTRVVRSNVTVDAESDVETEPPTPRA